jgi:hypothetical protein
MSDVVDYDVTKFNDKGVEQYRCSSYSLKLEINPEKNEEEIKLDNCVIPDPVNRPAHYQLRNGKEVIDTIEEMGWFENYAKGNILKYLLRAGKKDPKKEIEDLKKMKWYTDRLIEYKEKKSLLP